MAYFNLLILQFIAHILADYIFQSDKMCKDKDEHGFKTKTLYYHSFTILILSWLFSLQWNFFMFASIITVSHLLIDGFKILIFKKETAKKYSFFIDQSIHLLIMWGTVTLFAEHYSVTPDIKIPIDTKQLLLITSYLLCAKPANIIIKEILKVNNITIPQTSAGEILNAGKLIGIVERFLALTLILNGQYEAVGFIIASKSILRFKETDTSKTEYVLVGTLLSFSIAFILGIILQMYK
jgi:hypothetical protein